MSDRIWRLSILITVLAGLSAFDAVGWGPRAQKAISSTAIQVVRRTYPNAFKTEDFNYDDDVLRGADADPAILNGGEPFAREEDAIVGVEHELRLLREVRKYGFGSYFSYRMGLLGAVTADLVLPFSLDPTPEGTRIREQLEADVDQILDHFMFSSEKQSLRYIHDAEEYLAERRTFFADSRPIIANDYRSGRKLAGYMKEGAQVFFTRAVSSVADAWNTVLRVQGDPTDLAPSDKAVIAYLVSEVQYLLQEKKNFSQAVKAHGNLETIAKNAPQAYNKVGDLFYAYGTEEGKERGVREWRLAYEMPGSERRDIGKKLAKHYIGAGEALLAAAQRPGASDQDLPNALNAFTQALEFDQTSQTAAQRINETNTAIKDRNERRTVNATFIASAEKVRVQAEKARVNGDFGNAIATYTQAVRLYETIDDEFTDQATVAKDGIKETSKSITDIINQVLDAASDEIDKGDKAVTEHRFGDAMASYERVPNVVGVVPGDETTTHGKEKRDIIELSKTKIEQCKVQKTRFEEAERQRKAQAEAAARGGTPAPAAPAPGGGG
jgi:tetratricopeptide (TPR) repeat protein